MTYWKWEQALCPHEHHRDRDGIVRCCMCGHTTNPKPSMKSITLYGLAKRLIEAIKQVA